MVGPKAPVWVLVIGVCVLGVWCEQCKPDIVNPCRADCNGTTFDLNDVFDFPVVIDGGEEYVYTWDPCGGVNCTNHGLDCSVCQRIVAQYFNVSCGKMSNPVWIWETREPPSKSFPNWRIEYTFGDTWRISFFDFILDETQLEPVVKYMGENTALQYSFQVVGKCLGQPSPDCNKVYEKNRRRRRANNS